MTEVTKIKSGTELFFEPAVRGKFVEVNAEVETFRMSKLGEPSADTTIHVRGVHVEKDMLVVHVLVGSDHRRVVGSIPIKLCDVDLARALTGGARARQVSGGNKS